MVIKKTSTGIAGLDEILNGGYLKGKPTIIKGSPGTGKTLFTLFFASSQIQKGNNVIYVTCDESPRQIISHMDNFGLDGSKLEAEGKLLILDLTPEFDQEIAGEFDINAFHLRVEQAKGKNKANTLIIDSLQSLLLGIVDYNPNMELLNLFQWARDKRLTLLTTIADIKTMLETEIYEEYLADCAIKLRQKITGNLMTRYLRIIKLRGSPHGTNEYPFSIIDNGISLIPVTATRLDTQFSKEYLSTGIKILDNMLGDKGYQVGSPLMISGRSGTAKSLLSISFAQAAIKQGKRVLFVSFEEAPNDLIHNFKSIGIDLIPLLERKKLEINSRRPVEMGLEDHIISIIKRTEKGKFDFIVIDPISSLLDLGNEMDIKMLFIRFISYMKSKNKTMIFTELLPDYLEEHSKLGLSSLTDVWIRLAQVESNGEFNRMLYISKARGVKTSNQVKEFIVTNEGILIEEPYIGAKEMVFGSKKAACILEDKQQKIQRAQEVEQLEKEIKALDEQLVAQHKMSEVKYITKRNELLRKKSSLLNQEVQIQAQRESNRLLRD